eukprot:427099_1
MWSVLLLVFAISFDVIKGYHSIILLVDGSVEIDEENCIKQQNGIKDYFRYFHDFKGDDLLSYITFNQFGEINKIIDFNDEFRVPFDDLMNKIGLLQTKLS